MDRETLRQKQCVARYVCHVHIRYLGSYSLEQLLNNSKTHFPITEQHLGCPFASFFATSNFTADLGKVGQATLSSFNTLFCLLELAEPIHEVLTVRQQVLVTGCYLLQVLQW